jgi:hypothetical protein
MTEATRRGSCLCGAVRYTATGPMRPVIACHCSQCRKTSGHYGAATSAPRTHVAIEGAETLTRYESSPGVTREFCSTCGSQLFWNDSRDANLAIFAGTLDDATGLRLAGHIYCADKGAYYEIDDGLPQAAAGDEGLTIKA